MPTSDDAIPWDSPKVRGVLACTFVLPLGVSLLSPVLPIFRDVFGITDAEASLLFSLYFLPAVFLSPFLGMLADRYGRRPVLGPSLVLYGVLGAVIAIVDSFVLILVLRFVQGAAAAGVFILTVTYINDVFEGVQRNAVLGANAAILFIGAAIFPFVGGFLAAVDWHVPFVTYLVALPVALYAYTRLDESPFVGCKTGPEYLRGAAVALPRREASALYGSTLFLETVAFGGILTALPFLLVAKFNATPIVTGIAITAMMLLAAAVSVANGRLVKRRSNHRLIAMSFCCYGVGFIIIVSGPVIPIVVAGAAVVGIGFGLALPSVDAAIARISPPEYLAGAVSIRTSTTFLGRAGGPIAFAGLEPIGGYEPILFITGVIALLGGGYGLVMTDAEPMMVKGHAGG